MVFGDKKEGDDGGFIPDMVRRAVDRSLQALNQTDDERKKMISALLPKDLVHTIVQSALQAVDVTKREAVEIVGREMQQFLASLNLSDEIRKVLTSVSFQINTEVRFVPNEDGTLRSEVKARAMPKRTERDGRDRSVAKAKASRAKAKTAKTAKAAKVAKASAAAKTEGPPRPIAAQSRRAVVDATLTSARDAMHDAVAGTRSRVRQVVDRIAERTADLTDELADGEED